MIESFPDITHVRIGMVVVGTSPQYLKATLGTCVGIAFLWRKKNIAGLAHCLLPKAETLDSTIGAKYVDQAIESLIKIMNIKSSFDVQEIEVHMAGGGNMIENLGRLNEEHIGILNSKMAIEILKQKKFNILSCDVGGKGGRQITVNCHDFTVDVIKIEGQ